MTKITDEELASALLAAHLGIDGANLEKSPYQSAWMMMARKARELLTSSWPDPIPVVTGAEPVYPCLLSAKCGGWDSHYGPATPAQIKKLYSHWLPMPPSPVVDPFEEWWKENGRTTPAAEVTARRIWDAALKSKEAK